MWRSTHTSRQHLVLAAVLCAACARDAQAVTIGKAAPRFSAVDSAGKTHKLTQYGGHYVVLEWLNHGCPYVRKHYESNNMQRLQQRYTAKKVVWLSIISSAPGKQGYSTPRKAKADIAKYRAKPTAVLLDPQGKIGRLYGAKTTPHMYVISPKGKLLYAGAIDNVRSTDLDDVTGAQNYVSQALDQAMAGKSVTEPRTAPYGCSVKY